MILRRINQLLHVFIGYLIKWKVDLLGVGYVNKLDKTDKSPRLIVSLTSYGRRVEKIVYYTIVSMLKQELAPNKIVLWLDQNTWNDENLPKKIISLKKYGVEIKFCKDVRSYTKLVPALLSYSEDIIVTVDDDVYYSPKLLKRLYDGYLEFPNKIQCFFYSNPRYDETGKIAPYNSWNKVTGSNWVFPLGVGGVLYPPHALYSDVIKESLFMKLCPAADDLWFWFMALKQGTKHNVVSMKGIRYYAFDNLYQYFHKGSALTHSNSRENGNDVQLVSLFNHYQVKGEHDLNNITCK